MQFLIDSPEMIRNLNRIRTHAIANPIDLTNGLPADFQPVGDNPDHVLINGNLKIVYSVEIQNIGMCHHISISHDNRKPPAPTMVDKILEHLSLGNLKDGRDRATWFEHGFALNIIQPFAQIKVQRTH